MNFDLPFVPQRTKKPRNVGLTMMMDKGLSLAETENFIASSSEFTDVVKFGFGTSLITKDLQKKIELYKKADIKPYCGGTLFEAFIIRKKFDDFKKFISGLKLDLVEVSDGSMDIPHNKKLEYIENLAKDFTVLSEVGSKNADVEIPDDDWVDMMSKELNAGSWKVIAEARESGNLGIYNSDQSANHGLIDKITKNCNGCDIIWEAPKKPQQVWFTKLLGSDVNLGNIAPNEVISLETIRLGLRGDTFFDFLPDDLKQ